MAKKKLQKGGAEWKAVLKDLKGVDEMFKVLEKDKGLPRFGELFIACLVIGNAECVNLKTMFPKLYANLTALVAKK